MPIAVRRVLYGLMTVLGLLMMVPLVLNATRVQTALAGLDPLAVDSEVSAWISDLTLLFLAGLCVAASFLYLALVTGHRKAWRPIEGAEPRCARCGAALSLGLRRCPACDQQLTW